MVKFEWKILDIEAKDNIIKSAKYFCSAEENELRVETEGNWKFRDPEGAFVEYPEVTEQMVVEWISQEAIRDGKNLITSRLEEQLAALQNKTPVIAPWLPQVYTPKI
jgi:hypothetical protein